MLLCIVYAMLFVNTRYCCLWLSHNTVYRVMRSENSTLLCIQWPQILYVSLRLRMQNVVSAQPCVGKFQISLVLLNFLHCNFRLWFETP